MASINTLVAVATVWVALMVLPRVVEPIWPSFVALVGGERGVFIYGTYLATMVPLLLGNAFYALLYFAQIPFVERTKGCKDPWPWQQGPAARAEFWTLVLKSAALSIFNTTLVSLPTAPFSWPLVKQLGFRASTPLPGVAEVVRHVIASALIEDFVFYWGHRAIHHRSVYAWLHKPHHDYKLTVSAAVLHLHPVEFLLCNVAPIVAGPTLVGAHGYTWMLWIAGRLLQTMEAHSGYVPPWSPFRLLPLNGSGLSHEAHHVINTGNYGSLFGFWDCVCGTKIPDEVIAKRFGGGAKGAAGEAAPLAAGTASTGKQRNAAAAKQAD